MSVLIVIPARYESERFPGKPLIHLKGASGLSKSLVQRTWEVADQVKLADRIVVATDDNRIRHEVESFGGTVVMTSSKCRNGTERCDEANRNLGNEFDYVVNVQGDAPLTPPWFVDELISAMLEPGDFGVATPVLRCDGASLNAFRSDRRESRVGGTTVVFDSRNRALYFSKEVIPLTERKFLPAESTPVFHHVGVYAYTRGALQWYGDCSPGTLERNEGLEQLRFLEYGIEVKCVEVQAGGRVFWELNNPSDIELVESALAKEGID